MSDSGNLGRLPPLSRRKEMLQALTYVATGVSVLLGTLHMDLYIAVTTATVSLLTGILEYQKLEATVINLNNSSRVLQHTLMWCAANGSALCMRPPAYTARMLRLRRWDSLTFVEKRMAKHKDHLVLTTENALLSEVNQFYQKSPDDNEEGPAETNAWDEDDG